MPHSKDSRSKRLGRFEPDTKAFNPEGYKKRLEPDLESGFCHA
jgi:hypothetical protein